MLRFLVLLARLALRFEFAVIRSTNRFFEFVWLYFVLLEFAYVVLLDVELAFANIAAVLFIGETLMTSDFGRSKHSIPDFIEPDTNPNDYIKMPWLGLLKIHNERL